MAGEIYHINRPGPCVTLQYNGGAVHVFPLYDDFNLSVTQQTDRPVEKLINIVKEAIASLAPNSTFNTIITSVQQYQQLMGTQFLGKGFYASAWTGSTPASLSLKIKAFRGMNGSWNAKEEVFNPLQLIYSYTLPQAVGELGIHAPMPSGADVLVQYGAAIAAELLKKVTDFDANIAKTMDTATGGLSIAFDSKGASAEVNKFTSTSPSKVFGIDGVSLLKYPINNTWNIRFGYFTGKDYYSYVHFNECIVETSTIMYSKEVEYNNSQVFPIRGEVTLSLKSESIITNTDFGPSRAVASTAL